MKLNQQIEDSMKCVTEISEYISHIKKSLSGEIESFQSNEEHCLDIAKLAEQFATVNMVY